MNENEILQLIKRSVSDTKHVLNDGKPFEGTAYELGLKIMRYIDAMDSDYDVGKVVEKLEEIKGSACDGKSCSECEYTSDCLEGEQSEKVAIDKAIEIVNHGGAYDDVCEWKLVSDEQFIKNPHTKRLYSNEPSMKSVYCNTCGKKIRIVGD